MAVDHYFQKATLRQDVVGTDPEVEGWNHTGSFLTGDHNRPDLYLDLPGSPNKASDSDYCRDYNSAGGSTTAYARVFKIDSRVIIQYWLFYYFNPFDASDHEGDWELVQAVFPSNITMDAIATQSDTKPEWVGFSQHGSAQRRAFESISFENTVRPWVSAALGSHANSYAPISCDQKIDTDWRRPWLDSVRKEPAIKLITDEPWRDFAGLWGEVGSTTPPRSPSHQRPWNDPIGWMGSNSGFCPGIGSALAVGAQSPVELHLYDRDGRHVGIGGDGEVEIEIPGASYAQSEGTTRKAITVRSDPLSDSYRVEFRGTEKGALTLSVLVVEGNGTNEFAVIYDNVPVSAGSRGRVSVVGRHVIDLEIDEDGDGEFESMVAPDVLGTVDETPIAARTSGSGSSIPTFVVVVGAAVALSCGVGWGLRYLRKRRLRVRSG